jgi:sortase A
MVSALTVVADGPGPAVGEPAAGVRPPLPLAVRLWLAVALTASGLASFVAVFGWGLSGLQEQRAQHELYSQLRGLLDPSSTVAPPTGGAIRPGTPVALLSSPGLAGQSEVVVEGTSAGDLLSGPGHLRDSPLPGQAGQAVLLGRAALAGGPFHDVADLTVGSALTVRTGQGLFHYRVVDRRVAGDPVPRMPASGGLLTMVTSQGSGLIGHFAPDRIVYVDAALVGKPAPAPAGRPIAVPTAELPGHGDPSVWPLVVLWLIGLLAAAGAVVWAWLRWGRWQSWLLGIPILVGMLWGTADYAVRLLPNVL